VQLRISFFRDIGLHPNVPGFFIGPLIFEYVAITPSQNM